jgi:cellulose synthase/poly-beta-1,6-N-acetylglucosamine synthase-like glycosyltransferase
VTPPRLSVLLPCRDAAAFLPETIASLRAQTCTDFEVLAVDDGSRDDTPARLASWAAADARVRVLSTGGDGLVAALRLAATHARSDLLARMDADDIAAPRRFEAQLRLLAERPDLAGCGTGVRYFPRESVAGGALRYERWINSLVEPDAIARDIFVECPIPHPTLVLRRAAYDAVGGYRDTGWPEDYDLVLRLWAAGGRLGKVADVLLHWRERPDRASRTDPRYSPAAFRRCKVHWLVRTLLSGRVPGRAGGDATAESVAGPLRRVVVWGAGPVGKEFARELLRQQATVAAFVDLDPRKIGQQIHGAPVLAPADGASLPDAFTVAAVGSAQAREEIRSTLRATGRTELRDFCAVA